MQRRVFLKWLAAIPLLGLEGIVPVRGRGSHRLSIVIRDDERLGREVITKRAKEIAQKNLNIKLGPAEGDETFPRPWEIAGYEYYTPIEIQLDPHEYAWSSMGDTPFLEDAPYHRFIFETFGWYEGRVKPRRVLWTSEGGHLLP